MDPGERRTCGRYSPAHPLEDENLLQEILLHLPQRPSSLHRASLSCKRWRHIVSDPRFLCRFRKYHWKLLGFFSQDGARALGFTPMLDCIPAARFAVPGNIIDRRSRPLYFLGCRHGFALLLDHSRREAIMWDPITGGQRCVAFPRGVGNNDNQMYSYLSAAVVYSADDDERHLHHGDYCLSTFKLVVVWQDAVRNPTNVFACRYDSRSDVWGDIISTASTYGIANVASPSVMVGNALHWLLSGANILEFNIKRQTLVVIEKPAEFAHVTGSDVNYTFQISRSEDNDIGLAVLSWQPPTIQLWAREPNCAGVVSWMLQRTFQLDDFIPQFWCEEKKVVVTGYDEDTNVIFLSSLSHDFMLQFESMQFGYIGTREFMTPKITIPIQISMQQSRVLMVEMVELKCEHMRLMCYVGLTEMPHANEEKS